MNIIGIINAASIRLMFNLLNYNLSTSAIYWASIRNPSKGASHKLVSTNSDQGDWFFEELVRKDFFTSSFKLSHYLLSQLST